MNLTKLKCVLCLLFTSIIANNKLKDELKSSVNCTTISLNKFQTATANLQTPADIKSVGKFLENKFDKIKEIVFVLHNNFEFNLEYFKRLLKRKNLLIKISFDKEFKKCEEEKVELPHECINRFLKALSALNNLISLDISHLDLTELPESVYSFPALKVLNLSNNKLGNSKLECNKLPNLQTLDISKNELITSIDESICKLESLEQLKAQSCKITSLPQFDCNLKSLDLSRNPIKSIPSEFFKLKELEFLNLKGCELVNLTIDLAQLPKLESLDLSYNASLKSLNLSGPECAWKIKSLSILNCPLINVLATPNLKNLKIEHFIFNHQIDYPTVGFGDKFNLDELISINNFSARGRYYKVPRPLTVFNVIPCFKILFPFEIVENKLSKDQLVDKWTKICSELGLASGDQFKHSKKYLKNLYGEISKEYYSGSKYFMYPDYKEKMRSILANLFEKLNKNEEPTKLESRVKNILKIFERYQSEQLVYCNFLLNSIGSGLSYKDLYTTFRIESINILKDYIFTLLLNLKEYKKLLSGRIKTKSHGKFVIKETDPSDKSKYNIKSIMTILSKFSSKFTDVYVARTMFNLIKSDLVDEIFTKSEVSSELNVFKTLEDISNPSEITSQTIQLKSIKSEVEKEFKSISDKIAGKN